MKVIRNVMLALVCAATFLSVSAGKVVAEAPSDAQLNRVVQYLAENYGMEALRADSSNVITCQSGGSCAKPDGHGGYVNCSCGGGSTCPAGKTCQCTCTMTTGQGGAQTLTCAYDCVTPTPVHMAPGDVDVE